MEKYTKMKGEIMKYCKCKKPRIIHDPDGDIRDWCSICDGFIQSSKSKKLSAIAKKAWRGPNGRFAQVFQVVRKGKPTIEGLEAKILKLNERVYKLEKKAEII